MSFKRDGNDTNLLSVLQKRRIKDLFAEDIPKDEAKLLSNGRFACLVCAHHPIFDTVPMLSVHRLGKKHKAYEEIQTKKKDELQQLIIKRKQEQFHGNEANSRFEASSHNKSILGPSPYDCRVRKRARKGDRKLQVDLQSHHPNTDVTPKTDGSTTTGDPSCILIQPSSSTTHQQVSEQQLRGPIRHDYKLKNVFSKKREETTQISPYISTKLRPDQSSICPRNSFNTRCFEADSTQSNRSFSKSNADSFQAAQSGSTAELVNLNSHFPSPPPPPESQCTKPSVSVHASNKTKNLEEGVSKSVEAMKKMSKRKSLRCEMSADANKKQALMQNPLAEKYYQLQGSGWKRDWDGKWIKDDQAEFDSDEEPPDLP